MKLLMSLPAAACVAWAHIRGKPQSLPTSCILAVAPTSLPGPGLKAAEPQHPGRLVEVTFKGPFQPQPCSGGIKSAGTQGGGGHELPGSATSWRSLSICKAEGKAAEPAGAHPKPLPRAYCRSLVPCLKCWGKSRLHRPFQRGRGGSAPHRALAHQGQGVQWGAGSLVPHDRGPGDLQAVACDALGAFVQPQAFVPVPLAQPGPGTSLGGVWGTSASPTRQGTQPRSLGVPCGEDGGEAPGCRLPGTLHVSMPGDIPWMGGTPARSFPSIVLGHPPEHPQLPSSEWF